MWALLFVVLLIPGSSLATPAQDPGSEFMPIVTLLGCIENDGRRGFTLTHATEPVAVDDRLPEEPAPTTPLGEGRVRLIGTLDEFGVATRTGHKVRVRGLFVESDGGDRLNLTSILTLSVSCG